MIFDFIIDYFLRFSHIDEVFFGNRNIISDMLDVVVVSISSFNWNADSLFNVVNVFLLIGDAFNISFRRRWSAWGGDCLVVSIGLMSICV